MLCPIGWDSPWVGGARFSGNQNHLNSLLNSKTPKQMSFFGLLTSKSEQKQYESSEVLGLVGRPERQVVQFVSNFKCSALKLNFADNKITNTTVCY